MRRSWLGAVVVFLLACINAATISGPPAPDGTSTTDAVLTEPMTDIGRLVFDVVSGFDSAMDGGVDGGIVLPVMCAGTTCPSGQECCLTTGGCFDPVSNHAACPTPGDAGSSVRLCASMADCNPDEYCVTALCLGVGQCQPRDNCETCSSGNPGGCAVCSCDGHTYPDPQTACNDGVIIVNSANTGCGVVIPVTQDGGMRARIACGNNSAYCPSGLQCCAITGVCYDPACPDCCAFPPAGTQFPCVTDDQCDTGGYCAGTGCNTPGGCVNIRGTSGCNGVVSEVCGCDNQTYTNECWATGAGVRVAHTGACSGM